MYRRASSLFALRQGLEASIAIPTSFPCPLKVSSTACLISGSAKHLSLRRNFTFTVSRLGPWLSGDPFLDQDKKRGTMTRTVSQQHPKTNNRKQTFHIRPWGSDKSQEEWFRLSSLDLFNTQNYSTHALIFKLSDSQKHQVAEALRRGLENTLGQCRHMVGTVERNEFGDFSIAKKPDSKVKFVVQWLDGPEDDFPTYSEIEKTRFTSEILGDPSRLTIEGMTMACRRPPDRSPVMTGFQLNLIPGGLIFTIHKHHAALDIAGTTSLVQQIAANCYSILKGKPQPPFDEELMDRPRFITHFAREEQVDPPISPPERKHPDWLPCSWLLFHLPRSKAAKLKKLATPKNGTWISTHDAMTAFLWRVMSRCRARIYKPDLNLPALFFEAINMRDRLTPPLPARYQGNCLSAGLSTSQPKPVTLAEVISEAPLYRLASFVRQITTGVSEKTLQETLTMLAPVRDKWKVLPRLDSIPPMSFVVTDWRAAKMCDADFGFGWPRAFRQLSDTVVENMMMIYPPLELENGDPDQGVEVVLPFERHAVDMLIDDPDMKEFF